jgi:hypothetical protein
MRLGTLAKPASDGFASMTGDPRLAGHAPRYSLVGLALLPAVAILA